MDSSVLRSFRSLLAAVALWVTACAIAASADSATPPGAAPAAASPVAWLRTATDDLDVHLHAARQIPADASSPNLRSAAASSWSLGAKDAQPAAMGQGHATIAASAAPQPGLWTFLGAAELPIGWAFFLAAIGLMTTISRRRQPE